MIIVYSKIELSEKLRKKITEQILSYQNKSESEEIKFVVDETILSGIRININSRVIDLTLNHRLEKILDALK